MVESFKRQIHISKEHDRIKKLTAFVLALVCVLSLMGCADRKMTFDIGEASKIRIMSGLTGDKATISDQAFIQGITENINSLRFEKTASAEGVKGYAYTLTWVDAEDKQIAAISITDENGYQINHNGYFYKVGSDQSIDVAFIAETLDSAK